MESQMHRHHEDDPHTGEGEKKSVLKKVKEKAKKIKDTIKKHGHEHVYRHPSEEEDEEMGDDPEVHGAPMYESAVIRGTNLPIQTGVNLEKPTDKREDRYKPNVKNEVYSSVKDGGVTRASGMGKTRPELGPNVGVGVTTSPTGPGKMEPELGGYNPKVEDDIVTTTTTRSTGLAKLGPELGGYNPNVGDEGVTTGLGKMEPELGGYRGPKEEDLGGTTRPGLVKLGHELGSYNYPNREGEEVTTRPAGPGERGPELGGHGIGVKNEVYPKVGDTRATTTPLGPGKVGTEFGRPPVEACEPEDEIPKWSRPYTVDVETVNVEEPTVKIGPLEGIEDDPHAPKNRVGKIPASNYQSKVTDPTGEGDKEAEVSPLVKRLDNLHVHDKIEPKSYTGSHDQFAPQPTHTKDQFTRGSNPITPSESLESPEVYDLANPEFMPRDTIAEKISSATSVIADKAVAAKNMVASKLGYSGEHQETEDTSKKPVSESATDYAHKVAEKLAPVYEKVAGAGSAILSKVHGGGGAEEERGDTGVGETDKGVSVKEYLAVKLSPGDEDKALSEVITEALHKKQEGMEEEKHVARAEDVAVRLENKMESEGVVAVGSESSAGGAVDRLKDAVGSWFGKSTEQGEEEVGGQQRRLQESGN